MSAKPCPLEVFHDHGLKLLKVTITTGTTERDNFDDVRAKLCGPYGRVFEHERPALEAAKTRS